MTNLNPKPKWNKADQEGWKSGFWLTTQMSCECGREWVSVAPLHVQEVECPDCHQMVPVYYQVKEVCGG